MEGVGVENAFGLRGCGCDVDMIKVYKRPERGDWSKTTVTARAVGSGCNFGDLCPDHKAKYPKKALTKNGPRFRGPFL